MKGKKLIGVYGKADPLKHRYLDILSKFYGLTTKQICLPSQVTEMIGIVMLEHNYNKEILEEAIKNDIPILLEIPFANSLDKEVELLEQLIARQAKVLLPLIVTHHPKLTKLKSFMTATDVLGSLQSLHITTIYHENYLREEPYFNKQYSGKLIYQLLNFIDIFSWISPLNFRQVRVWVPEKNNKILLIHVKLEGAIGTGISTMYKISSVMAPPVEVHIEAVFFNRILVWDSTEQSSILNSENGLAQIRWGMNIDELIAWRFVELLRGMISLNEELKRILRSYKILIEILRKSE